LPVTVHTATSQF